MNNEGSNMYAFNYVVVGGGGGGPLQKTALCLKLWFSPVAFWQRIAWPTIFFIHKLIMRHFNHMIMFGLIKKMTHYG
jgi:hypothetical protein